MPDQRETLVRKMIDEGTSDEDIRATLKVFDGRTALPTRPVSAEDFTTPPAHATATDVGIGALKGLGSTVAGLGELAVNAGLIPGVTPSAFNPAMRHPVFRRADEATTPTTTAQHAGKLGEQIAEVAVPVGLAANAIPRAGRAATKFQQVMSAAKDVPVNATVPGEAALRIAQLGERGGTTPRAVTQFLRRVTDPAKAPMVYGEARDFASNISRLSADEFKRLTPVIQREMGTLRTSLNTAVGDAADQVGMKAPYESAMKEYASAAKLKSYRDVLMDALKRGALPAAGVAGAGYWLGSKARGLFGGEQ